MSVWHNRPAARDLTTTDHPPHADPNNAPDHVAQTIAARKRIARRNVPQKLADRNLLPNVARKHVAPKRRQHAQKHNLPVVRNLAVQKHNLPVVPNPAARKPRRRVPKPDGVNQNAEIGLSRPRRHHVEMRHVSRIAEMTEADRKPEATASILGGMIVVASIPAHRSEAARRWLIADPLIGDRVAATVSTKPIAGGRVDRADSVRHRRVSTNDLGLIPAITARNAVDSRPHPRRLAEIIAPSRADPTSSHVARNATSVNPERAKSQ